MIKLPLRRSSAMSLPKDRTVHGIKVTKVPVGKYIQSMQEIQDLPQTILEACFPEDEDLGEVMGKVKTGNALDVIGNLLAGAPEIIIGLAATFLEVEEEALLALSPSELLDVLDAWWELNDLSDFLMRVWGKVKPLIASYQTRDPGSSDG